MKYVYILEFSTADGISIDVFRLKKDALKMREFFKKEFGATNDDFIIHKEIVR